MHARLTTIAALLILVLTLALEQGGTSAQIAPALTTTPSRTSTADALLPLVVQAPPPTDTPVPALPTNTMVPGVPTATSTQPPVGPTNPPPTLPPSLNNCQQDPLASQAPNFPIQIVAINKQAETVTLRNRSGAPINLTGWTMCSILGNQVHPIGGVLASEEQRTFSGPAGSIWNNSARDDGALYDAEGRLVSYFADR